MITNTETIEDRLPPEVAKNLASLPDEMSESFGEMVLGLSQTELYSIEKTGTSMERSQNDAESLPDQQSDPENATGLMGEVSKILSEAFNATSEQEETPQIGAESLLEKAIDLTIEKAIKAKAEGNHEATISQMRLFSVINTMRDVKWGVADQSQPLAETIIRSGLAKELVVALNESQGTVYAHRDQFAFDGDEGRVVLTPLYRQMSESRPMLELASGLEFDENFDYLAPLETGSDGELSEQQQVSISSLTSEELVTLAVDALRNSEEPGRAIMYANSAMESLVVGHGRASAEAVVDLLKVAQEVTTQDGQFESQYRSVVKKATVMRQPNYHYRGNSAAPGILDRVVVELMATQQVDLARELISGATEDQKSTRWFWSATDVSPENAQELTDQIIAISKEKAETIGDYLEQRGLGQGDIESILNGLSLPEATIDAPEKFWEIIKEVFKSDYPSAELNKLSIRGKINGSTHELSEFLGEGAYYKFELMSKLVVIAYENGLELDVFNHREIIGLKSEEEVMHKVEQRIALNSTVEEFASRINGESNEWHQVTAHDIAKYAQQFENPAEALKMLGELYLPEVFEMNRYYSPELRFRELTYHFNNIIGVSNYGSSSYGIQEVVGIDEQMIGKLHEVQQLVGELTQVDGAGLKRLIQAEDYRERFDLIKGSWDKLSSDRLNRVYPGLASLIIERASEPSLQDKIEAFVNKDIIRALEDGGVFQFTKGKVVDAILLGHSELVFNLLSDTELIPLISSESDLSHINQVVIEGVLAGKFDRATALDVLTNPDAVRLIDPQSPAYFMADALLLEILESDDPKQVISIYSSIFSDTTSLWMISANLTLHKYGQSRFSAGRTSEITKLPNSLPVDGRTEYSPDHITYVTGEEAIGYLKLAGASEEAIAAYTETGHVNLSELPEELIKTVLVGNVYETITMSRDYKLRQEASKRNSSLSAEDVVVAGNLVHGAPMEVLSRIIQNGCLPGEFLLSSGRADNTPLAADFIKISESSTGSFRETIASLPNSAYGDVDIIFRREDSGYREGEEYLASIIGDHHYVVSGGLPSTEIVGIVVRSNDKLETIKVVSVQNGMYVPIFSASGEMLFSHEEYSAMRNDGNYEIIAPVHVDGAIRQPDSQKGSNEGAVFVLPETNGLEAGRYYVKFSTDSDQQHLWNELLSDSIYRAIAPELVPDTVPVFIEGRMGRASKVAEADDVPVSNGARNAGFVLDALLGNWDAVYNTNNLFMSEGVAMRIDTGNSLFYRARGQQKTDENFGPIVTELELGTDTGSLGKGMRQMYPGLTQESVDEQVGALSEELTDKKIDELVDNVRMPKEYRDKVATVLKQRRDYIVGWVSSEPLAPAA